MSRKLEKESAVHLHWWAPAMMDDAALNAMIAEMDEMRRKQKQQTWDLQAKLGMISSAEIDAVSADASRPIASAHSSTPTMVARPTAAHLSAGIAPPPSRAAAPPRPSGHGQLRSSLLGESLLTAPSEHGTCSSISEAACESLGAESYEDGHSMGERATWHCAPGAACL